MCKNSNFATQEDKYFKRKVKGLQVSCPHKNYECDWVGELGQVDVHSTVCPKRPWKCPHCAFETTFDKGTGAHTSICSRYPQPCPNRCEIGTVPRSEVEEHLMSCPLQVVECDFAHAGCRVMIPRKDVTKHLTENAQVHLMNATILNLQLTKQFRKEMTAKDQQITALQKQTTEIMNKVSSLEQRIKIQGYSCHMFTLIKFKEHQSTGKRGSWYSDTFYSSPGGYCFKLNVDTNGYGDAHGSHLSSSLYLQSGPYDNDLKWPIKCTVHLQMLNQRGEYGHHTVVGSVEFKQPVVGDDYKQIGTTTKMFPLRRLGFYAIRTTEYLKNNCLQFRLYINVNPKA